METIIPNSIFYLIGILLLLGVFFSGFFVAKAISFNGRRKKNQNLKRLLYKELCENFRVLNKIRSKKNKFSLPPIIISQQCVKLTTSVYEAYLGRMDDLKPALLDKLCNAYIAINHAIQNSKEFIDLYSRRKAGPGIEEFFAARSISIIGVSRRAYNQTLTALKAFPTGKKTIKEYKHSEGASVRSYAMLGDLWVKDESGRWQIPLSAAMKREHTTFDVIPPDSN